MIKSLLLPLIAKCPFLSKEAKSPVFNHPSLRTSLVASSAL